MTYEPIAGDYGVVQTNGPIGFLIQLGTMTKYNHAFIYIGNGQIIEATPRHGVIVSPVTNYENIAWNQHEVKTDEQRAGIVAEAKTHLGASYNFLDYFAIIMRIARFNAPFWLTRHIAASKSEICSELVAQVYRKCSFIVDGEREDFYVTPSDLAYRLLYI